MEVVALERQGPILGDQIDQDAEGNHLSLVVAHLEQTDVFDVVAIFPGGLDGDLPVPSKGIEAVDPRRAQVHLQRLIDVRQGHAQGFDLVPVHVQEQLRRVRAEGGDHVIQAGLPGQFRRQRFGLLLQGFQAKPTTVFDDQLEAPGLAEARDRRRR